MKYGSGDSGTQASQVGTTKPPTRRAVLRGAGGVAVALPLMQSLVPRGAQAATIGKRFVAFTTEHGGINGPNMVPGTNVANETAMLWHKVKHGSLVTGAQKSGGNTVISPVLTAPSSALTDKLLGKMNVLMGFDVPMYLGHTNGTFLGHYGQSDQGPGDLKDFATIDQLLAWSPRFYPSTTGITQRSIITGNNRGVSFGWSNPAAKSGSLQKLSATGSTQALFDKLFAGVTPPPAGTPAPPKRTPVVDRILQSYKSLRSSNRRLSMEDKRRLDDHVGALDELDRRIGQASGGGSTLTCTAKKPATSAEIGGGGGLARATSDFKLLNDVVAMALGCGVSRVATICVTAHFSDYQGDWHQSVAHQHTASGPQGILVDALRKTFEATILDLASKLDAYEDSPGVTALDNSLVQWTQEAGIFTHDQHAMTVVTFGGAGGFFKTGRFVDYRSGLADGFKQEHGILYRQWLANALLAMGIPASEFEDGGQPGYGDPRGSTGGKLYSPEIFPQTSKPLPLVTNG